jgi:hypothetical protein
VNTSSRRDGIMVVPPTIVFRGNKKNTFGFVYYESINRELKIKPIYIYECRCDERLQTKTKRFTRLSYTVGRYCCLLLLYGRGTSVYSQYRFGLDKRRVTCSIQNKKNMSSREHVSPAEKGNRVHSNCRNGPWTASRIVNLSGCLFSRPRPSLHLPLHLCLQAVHLGNQELKNLSTNLSTQSCGRLWPIRERKKVSWE